MAKWTDYTPEQQIEIDYLIRKGSVVHKNLTECRSHVIVDMEKEAQYTTQLAKIKADLKEVLEAKEMLDFCIEQAQFYTAKAEEIQRKWKIRGVRRNHESK